MPRKTMIEAIRDAMDVMMERDDNVVVFGEDVGYLRRRVPLHAGPAGRSTARAAASTRRSANSASSAPPSAWRPTGCGPASRSSSPTTCIRPTTRSCRRRRGCATARTAQFTCPLVVRMPTGGGIFGGQTHSQSPEALFTHVSGLKTVVPSNPVRRQGPADRGDRGSRSGDLPRAEAALQRPVRRPPRPAGDAVVEASSSARCRTATTPCRSARPRSGAQGAAVTVLAYGTMVYVAEAAAAETGIDAEIIDLRTLLPLDLETIVASVQKTGRCVDRARGDADLGLRRGAVGAGAGELLLPSRGAGRARRRLGHALSACAGMGLLPRPGPRRPRAARDRDGGVRWREHVIKLPDVGEGVAEAELVEWHVKVGDLVREDTVLAAVMTDKATVEIPSPVDGDRRGAGRRGRATSCGRLRAGPPGGRRARATRKCAGQRRAKRRRRRRRRPSRPHAAPAPERLSPSAARRAPRRRSRRAPLGAAAAARREAARLAGGAPARARGRRRSAPGARQRPGRPHHPRGPRRLPARRPAGRDVPAGRAANTAVEDVKVVGLRRRIAEKMAESQARIPHFTYVEEVDVTALEELRATLNAENRQDRPKLTLLPFLMRALVQGDRRPARAERALRRRGRRSSHQHAGVHIGIATQTPAGPDGAGGAPLPRRSICGTAPPRCSGSPKRRATGTATRDELTGSTITITCLGALGGIVTTPVINHPEVAIVGVNKMVVRPVWHGAQFVPRKMMNLSSSLRSPRHRRLGRGALRPAHQGPARDAGDDLHRGVSHDRDRLPRCWSSAAGPAAMSAAIRAGQLGLDTVLVERRPRRAGRHLPQRRLHSVEGADPCRRRIRQASRTWRQARAPLGICGRAPTLDLARTIAWKDGIVGRLTSGVAGLLKKARVKIVAGLGDDFATARPPRSRPRPARRSIRAEHVVIATGSEPVDAAGRCRSAAA